MRRFFVVLSFCTGFFEMVDFRLLATSIISEVDFDRFALGGVPSDFRFRRFGVSGGRSGSQYEIRFREGRLTFLAGICDNESTGPSDERGRRRDCALLACGFFAGAY